MSTLTTTPSTAARGSVLEKPLQMTFLGLLVVRSVTELFSGLSWAIGPFAVNLSIVTVLLMDGVGVFYLGLLWWRGEKVGDRVGGAFGLWALSWAPWVYLAAAEFGVAGLTGLREWVRLLSLALLYLVTREIARRQGPERVLSLCLLALPIPLVLTYYQIALAPTTRAFGGMVHPNNLGAFLVVMIALTVWKLLQPIASSWKRVGWGGVLLAELIALLASISSNAWLMFGVFVVLVAILVKHRPLRIMAAIAAGASVIIFGLFWAYNAAIQLEVQQNLRDLGVLNPAGSKGGTLEWRFQTWGDLLEVWQQKPFIGYGLNTVPFVNSQIGKAAHNDFLRYLVEGGIPGFLFFLIFQGVVIGELLRRYRHLTGSPAQVLVAVALSLAGAWVIGSVGDNVISYTVFQVYLWALLAVASVVSAEAYRPLQGYNVREPTVGAVRELPLHAERCCRRCQASDIHAEDLLCPRCYTVVLGLGGLLFLAGWVLSGVFLTGFYLWNQGAGAESFFISWIVWYGVLAIVLRHAREGYLSVLILTALTGWLALTWFFPALSWKIPELALGGLGAAQLGGMIVAWKTAKTKRVLAYLRGFLLPTGMLLIATLSLKGLLEAIERFLYSGEMLSLGFIALGMLGLVVAFGGILWGIAQHPWYELWRSWALSAGFLIALVQFSALVTAGALYSLARALPTVDVLRRFAPLVPERSLGLYTWGALGALGALVVIWWHQRRKEHSALRG